MSRSNRDIGSGNGLGAHIFDLIPAYIDNTLEGNEGEFVRAHLDACPECRADYLELRATQQMLRSVPVVVPPRAFTLTEEMVAQPKRRSLLDVLLAPRNTPRFAFGSVLSFGLLLLVLFNNVLLQGTVVTTFTSIGSGLGDSRSSEASAPAPSEIQAYASEASPTAAAAAAGEAPAAQDMPAGTPVPETPSGALPGGPPALAQGTQVPWRGSTSAMQPTVAPAEAAGGGPPADTAPTAAVEAQRGVGGRTGTSGEAAKSEPTPDAFEGLLTRSITTTQGEFQWSGVISDFVLTQTDGSVGSTGYYPYQPPSAPFPTIEVALALLGVLMAAAAFLSRSR